MNEAKPRRILVFGGTGGIGSGLARLTAAAATLGFLL
jgi:NAD(P)-dependent dehydrogenase (short-subunit alcohol dehydrogenase family)